MVLEPVSRCDTSLLFFPPKKSTQYKSRRRRQWDAIFNVVSNLEFMQDLTYVYMPLGWIHTWQIFYLNGTCVCCRNSPIHIYGTDIQAQIFQQQNLPRVQPPLLHFISSFRFVSPCLHYLDCCLVAQWEWGRHRTHMVSLVGRKWEFLGFSWDEEKTRICAGPKRVGCRGSMASMGAATLHCYWRSLRR